MATENNTSVNSPTYYGPVTTSGSSSTAIDSQTAGSLAVLVQQVSDQAPYFTEDNGTYVEVWKGPYSVVKDLPAGAFKIGNSLKVAHAGISGYVSRFSEPDPGYDGLGKKRTWNIKQTEVQECEAGDHAIIRVTYSAYEPTSSSGTTYSDATKDVWNLTWQSYNVSPYAFCANNAVQDQLAKEYKADDSETAWRRNIEKFLNADHTQAKTYEYRDAMDNQIYCLNEAERKVTKKILDGTGAVYHYPILMHQTSETHTKPESLSTESDISAWLNKVKYTGESIGGDIDHVTKTVPDGCSYTFKTDWQWVKVGDQMTSEKSSSQVSFTRVETWWGVISADPNFYGDTTFDHGNLENCRWEVGKV